MLKKSKIYLSKTLQSWKLLFKFCFCTTRSLHSYFLTNLCGNQTPRFFPSFRPPSRCTPLSGTIGRRETPIVKPRCTLSCRFPAWGTCLCACKWAPFSIPLSRRLRSAPRTISCKCLNSSLAGHYYCKLCVEKFIWSQKTNSTRF